MKRIIKFKAKRLDNGEWPEGSLLLDGNKAYIADNSKVYKWLVEVDPSTVCQFTGLKDKDGVEVWEGDLLYDYMETTLAEVVFENGAFMIGDSPLSDFVLWDEGIISLPVVGSKFDRKEGEV